MTSEPVSARLGECIDLYLHAWQFFGDRAFTPGTLAKRLVDHERDIEYITDEDEPERHLDLLVAYGLLGWTEDDHYRVESAPNEDLETWQERQATRTEVLHEYVQRHYEDRTTDPEVEGDDHLRRHGETFASVDVDDEVGSSELTDRVMTVMDAGADVAGVVLRSPAALTAHVQQLADDLCNRERMADASCGPFEKATADVVGEHKDDLEYRLYLREME